MIFSVALEALRETIGKVVTPSVCTGIAALLTCAAAVLALVREPRSSSRLSWSGKALVVVAAAALVNAAFQRHATYVTEVRTAVEVENSFLDGGGALDLSYTGLKSREADINPKLDRLLEEPFVVAADRALALRVRAKFADAYIGIGAFGTAEPLCRDVAKTALKSHRPEVRMLAAAEMVDRAEIALFSLSARSALAFADSAQTICEEIAKCCPNLSRPMADEAEVIRLSSRRRAIDALRLCGAEKQALAVCDAELSLHSNTGSLGSPRRPAGGETVQYEILKMLVAKGRLLDSRDDPRAALAVYEETIRDGKRLDIFKEEGWFYYTTALSARPLLARRTPQDLSDADARIKEAEAWFERHPSSWFLRAVARIRMDYYIAILEAFPSLLTKNELRATDTLFNQRVGGWAHWGDRREHREACRQASRWFRLRRDFRRSEYYHEVADSLLPLCPGS